MPRIPPDRPGYGTGTSPPDPPAGYVCYPEIITRPSVTPICPDCPEECPISSTEVYVGTGSSSAAAVADALANCVADATRCDTFGSLCTESGGGCAVDEDVDCVCVDGDWTCMARVCCENVEGVSNPCVSNSFAYMPQTAEGLVNNRDYIDLSGVVNDPVIAALRVACDINYDVFAEDGTFVDLYSAFERAMGPDWITEFLPLLCYCITVKYPVGFLRPMIRKFDQSGLYGGGGGGSSCAAEFPECDVGGSSGESDGPWETLQDAMDNAMLKCEEEGVCDGPPPAVTEQCGCIILSCYTVEEEEEYGYKCSWQLCCRESEVEPPEPFQTCLEVGGMFCEEATETEGAEKPTQEEAITDAENACATLDFCTYLGEDNCGSGEPLCTVTFCARTAGGWKCRASSCCHRSCAQLSEEVDCEHEVSAGVERWSGVNEEQGPAADDALSSCKGDIGIDPCVCEAAGWVDCEGVSPTPACYIDVEWCEYDDGFSTWTCWARCCCQEYSEEFEDCVSQFGEDCQYSMDIFFGESADSIDEAKAIAIEDCETFGVCDGGYEYCGESPSCNLVSCEPYPEAGTNFEYWSCTAELCCQEAAITGVCMYEHQAHFECYEEAAWEGPATVDAWCDLECTEQPPLWVYTDLGGGAYTATCWTCDESAECESNPDCDSPVAPPWPPAWTPTCPTGACCREGVCTVEPNEGQCVIDGGSWMGDWTMCTPDPCV